MSVSSFHGTEQRDEELLCKTQAHMVVSGTELDVAVSRDEITWELCPCFFTDVSLHVPLLLQACRACNINLIPKSLIFPTSTKLRFNTLK